METINPELKPRFYFHYYSTHGVCLPNYFPSATIDTSFGFSLAVVMINAVCFIGIAVTYVGMLG